MIVTILTGNESLQTVACRYQLSARSLQRWVNRYQSGGFDALTPLRRTDWKTTKPTNEQWQELAQALCLCKPAFSMAQIHRWIKQQAARRELVPPSYHSVYRWCSLLDKGLRYLASQGSAQYAHQFDLVHRWESQAPNALWQADHTLLDIWVVDEKGERVRPWLTIIEDDYSRAICGYLLSTEMPTAQQTALALRQAIYPKSSSKWPIHGLPSQLYTDRGRDFMSEHLEEVCLRLHIQVIRARPRQPRGKGKVERLFSTINTQLLQQLPHYTKQTNPEGNEEPLLTLAQLDTHFDRFINQWYHLQIHSSTGQTPLERWCQGGYIPNQPPDWSLLDELLITIRKSRKVGRDGIRFKGFRYIATTLAAYVGESVSIRYDPRDLAQVRVYHQDAFLCNALCESISHQIISLKDIIRARRQVKAARQARIQAAADLLRRVDEPMTINTPVPTSSEDVYLPPPAVVESTLKLYRYGHRS